MLFHFGRTISDREVPLLHMHDVGIERVQSFKLLGVYISYPILAGLLMLRFY